MNVGKLRHEVKLEHLNQKTGDRVQMSPLRVKASIEPGPPAQDDRRVMHYVTIRYHPQVTIDTVAVFKDRDLFVRGVQNVEERNAEMRLLCEEIVP